MAGVKIIEAVACASSMASASTGGKPKLARAIEEAMVGAIKAAQEEGITDPDTIRSHMLEAREAVKAANSD